MVAQIPISVAALVRDGLVLLVHRHPSRRWYPDCWDLVGGHIESGELPHQAVSRECLEELGVHVQDPLPIPMTISDPTLDMHAFLVTRWEGEPVNAASWTAEVDLSDVVLVGVKHNKTIPVDISLTGDGELKGISAAGTGARKEPKYVALQVVID
jgi:8-oxo-dGTP diphosphatase